MHTDFNMRKAVFCVREWGGLFGAISTLAVASAGCAHLSSGSANGGSQWVGTWGAAPQLTDSAAMVMLESAPSAMRSKSIDPDVRRQLVAAEAYFRAERRGFTAGNELDDWVAAEMAVDTRLQQSQVA